MPPHRAYFEKLSFEKVPADILAMNQEYFEMPDRICLDLTKKSLYSYN